MVIDWYVLLVKFYAFYNATIIVWIKKLAKGKNLSMIKIKQLKGAFKIPHIMSVVSTAQWVDNHEWLTWPPLSLSQQIFILWSTRKNKSWQ